MKFLLILVFFIVPAVSLFCEVVFFKNGDKLSGTISESNTNFVIMETDSLGKVSIDRSNIQEILLQPAQLNQQRTKGTVSWDNSFKAGLAYNYGNSALANLSGGFRVNRNALWINEWLLETDFDRRLDHLSVIYERIGAEIRYGQSFTDQWYGFVSLNYERDLSAGLQDRMIPIAGSGYWILDNERLKLLGEAGTGLSHSLYVDKTSTDEWKLYGRIMLEWTIMQKVVYGTDFKYMPNVTSLNSFTINNRHSLQFELIKDWKLGFIYTLNYNSIPLLPGLKNTDHSLNTQVEWSFK